MSDLQRLTDLQYQASELEIMIEEARIDEDIVAQLNFQTRLNGVLDEINALSKVDAKVGEVAILFDGPPVDGKRSIDASFATTALEYFQGIVTSLNSSRLRGKLGSRGKIKGSDLSRLNITGLATGSFGFVLEEREAQQKSAVKTPLRESIEEAATVIADFTQEDDDAFLVEMDDINPRVFASLSRFFRHLENNSATLKATLPDRYYRFDQAGISRAYRRISETNVKIDSVRWVGRLVGLTPFKRSFEFKIDGSNEVITGKFSHQVSQDYLERIESADGITLGHRFKASIERATLRKPNGSTSVSYTATNLVEVQPENR